MAWKRKSYCKIKDCMKPGDVIAFSKDRPVSKFIELITDSEVAHVGVVLHATLLIGGEPQGKPLNLVAEATSSGVRISRLCGLQENYDGEIWWLPLSCESRETLKPNLNSFCQFLLDADGNPYDFENAIIEGLQELIGQKRSFLREAVDAVFSLFRRGNAQALFRELIDDSELADIQEERHLKTFLINWLISYRKLANINSEEDVKKYFCSELVSEAFRCNGIINVADAEAVNPIELCQFRIYADDYVQFSGDEDKEIEGFNSKSPRGD